jgi:hypothetical protein
VKSGTDILGMLALRFHDTWRFTGGVSKCLNFSLVWDYFFHNV